MKSGICVECGSRHTNSNVDKSIKDKCFNCEVTLMALNAYVLALNLHKPINGHRRKLTILKYKLEVDRDEH